MIFDAKFFDQPIGRLGTHCEKWDALRERNADPDLLPMWVADMDFASPPAVVQALEARAAHPVYGYTEVGKDDITAFVDFWQRRHGLAIDPVWAVLLPCVVTGLRLAVQTLTEPGAEVIVQPPVYGPFYMAAQDAGRKLALNPLRIGDDGRYAVDFEDLEGHMKRGAKLLMLCSPHNPVGRAFARGELARMLALAKQYGVRVVCDEIHADFVYAPARHVSVLALPGSETGVIALCSASKTFNIAGLQQAMLVCPEEELRQSMAQTMNVYGITCGNLMALEATRAAYTQGDAWLDGLMAYLDASRKIVTDFFAAHLPRIIVTPLEATYLMWLDCRALGKTEDELMRLLREKGHVELTPGSFFGEQGQGFLRLNIGCPHAQLHEALRRIQAALGDL